MHPIVDCYLVSDGPCLSHSTVQCTETAVLLLIAFVVCYSLLQSRLTALMSHVILSE